MAAGYREPNLDGQNIDRYPLLMDHTSSLSSPDHVVIIRSGNPSTAGQVDREGLPHGSVSASHGSNSATLPSPNTPSEVAISVGSLARSLSLPIPSPTQSSLGAGLLERSVSFGRNNDATNHGARQRSSPLNSGLWISIELTITLSQIIASIIVLSLSTDEKPQVPLAAWVIGHAAGCFATLPLLYWRYTHRYMQQHDQDSFASSGGSPSSPQTSPHTSSYSLPVPTSAQDEDADSGLLSSRPPESSSGGDVRLTVFMQRFKIVLDCFFAVWFVLGNVWIFGGHSSSSEAPNLYRLCIVFLTFSCVGYALPFILCATICCCLPCIIQLFGFHEAQKRAKGAAPEVIEALPTYKFKSKSTNGTNGGKKDKDGNESDNECPGEGGYVAAGTVNERSISAEDAVCCICLGKYKDDIVLRELPCAHFFHVECVDKWLKINACCPLCKHEIVGSTDQTEHSLSDAGEQRDR